MEVAFKDQTRGYDEGNELFGDGEHDDGEAADGVYGGTVIADQDVGMHQWQIATADWSENHPHHPSYPLANAVLFLLNPGESVHFRLDTNPPDDGWQPATKAAKGTVYNKKLKNIL